MRFLAPAFLIAGIAISLVATPATAAEFKRMPQVDGPDIIVLSGLLQPDDDNKFAAIAAGINQAVIVLNSIGGNNNAAAHIGSFIRSHNYETRVHNGATCNSACVLIWIAGSFRHLDRYARLGVHSAITEGEPTVRDEEANKAIAVYLRSVGAPKAMIDLQPLADPCCINYIDYAQAKKWGLLSDKQAPPPTTSPVPSPSFLEDSIKIELSCTSKNAPDLKEMRVAYEAKNGQSTYFYPVYVTKDGTWFGVIDNYRRTYQIDWVGGTAKSDYLMSYWWFGEHKQKPRMKLYYKLTLFADHTATLADEHTGDKKLDKIVYKCTEVHQ